MNSDSGSTNSMMAATEPDGDALPAIVRSRADGSKRFICYAPDVEATDVDDQWLSVDAEFPVSTLLIR